MKTISIRLKDSDYEKLDEMLDEMGQTKQTFYESYTKTVLRQGMIPFIITVDNKSPYSKSEKLAAFDELENLIDKHSDEFKKDFDPQAEIERAIDKKYGRVD